jgi:hypothetical protein
MKHNEGFANLALELMRERLKELFAKQSLVQNERTQLQQLAELVESKHTRPCLECCGVGVVRFAYTPVVGKDSFILARADEDQAGYVPQPSLGKFPTYQCAQQAANKLNEEIGLDAKTAFGIATSSIRAQNLREQASGKGQ